MSDEFSAHPLHRSWTWENPGNNATYMTIKGRFILNVAAESDMNATTNHAPKILRKPMDGDWLVDTHYTETTEKAGSPSQAGIILYGSDNHWILWGNQGNESLQAYGMLEKDKEPSALEGVQSIPEKAIFFRIRKRSYDAAHTRYYFYYSQDRMTWAGTGFWEDKLDLFKDARIGLAGRAWGEGYTVEFDYFTEYIPVNDIDEFNGTVLDPIWNWTANPDIDYTFTGGNLANGDIVVSVGERPSSENIPFAATLLRHPISAFNQDWIVDTHHKSAPEDAGSNGLILYKNADNWLFWGYNERGLMEAGARINSDSFPLISEITAFNERIRIIKKRNQYTLECSHDGILWKASAFYIDQANQLDSAQYGFAFRYSASTAYQASYAFFRERYAPTGTLGLVTELNQVNMITGPDAPNDTRQQDLHGYGFGQHG